MSDYLKKKFEFNTIPFDADFDITKEFPLIIISYATKSNNGEGKEIMFAIAHVLNRFGFTSFNGYQVKAGQNWQKEWYGIMPQAKIAIIILSPEYFESEACRKECLELIMNNTIKLIPIQFGMPNMKGYFLGDDVEQIKAANILKQRILNVLPPPDQGSFKDNWEKNCQAMINRIKELLPDTVTCTLEAGQAEEQLCAGTDGDDGSGGGVISIINPQVVEQSANSILNPIEQLAKASDEDDLERCVRLGDWVEEYEKILKLVKAKEAAKEKKNFKLAKTLKAKIDAFPKTIEEFEKLQLEEAAEVARVKAEEEAAEVARLKAEKEAAKEALIQKEEYVVALKANGTINEQNNNGHTPMFQAVHDDDPEVIRLLLKHGADPNLGDKDQDTPLIMASYNGQTEVVKLLIAAGADLNLQDKAGESPLHIASYWGRTESMKLLIAAGANVNLRDNNGQTALAVARSEGETECVKLLEAAGAKSCLIS